jgi:hypothetical protein
MKGLSMDITDDQTHNWMLTCKNENRGALIAGRNSCYGFYQDVLESEGWDERHWTYYGPMWVGLAAGWNLSGEGGQELTYYDQCDPSYTISGLGEDGTTCKTSCGAYSMATIAASLTGDNSITGRSMTEYYLANGYYTAGVGASAPNEALASNFGLNFVPLGTDMERAKAILAQGGLVMVSWNGSLFSSSGGHVFIIRKIVGDNVYIASSGHSEQNATAWPMTYFTDGHFQSNTQTGQVLALWGFTKK